MLWSLAKIAIDVKPENDVCNFMKKIDQKNKICIYLDQFVVSNLVQETNELWKEIKELLEVCHYKNQIYCPLSHQHILETAKKELNNAIIHDEYFRKLSDSYFYKDELFLTPQLISSLIRKNKYTLNTFLLNYELKKFEDFYSKIKNVNNVFDESINFRVSPQNEIRKILNNNIEFKLEKQLIKVIKKNEVNDFIDRLQEYIEQKRIYIRPDNFGKHDFPHWIDQTLYQLTYKHSFKENQFKMLLNELKKNGFDRIPTLNIRFSMDAYLAVKNKQQNISDHIDIMRITNGLLPSDIFFTDKKRKFEIAELELDKLYNTQVFTGTENDLKEFITFLRRLV